MAARSRWQASQILPYRSIAAGQQNFEMPAISRFFGITIAMYFDDHQPPHFHARAGEFSAKIRTDTLELLVGDLPRRELRLVLGWAELHASELQDNWRRARVGETLQGIEPLQ